MRGRTRVRIRAPYQMLIVRSRRGSLSIRMRLITLLMMLSCVCLRAAEGRPNILLILADNWRFPNAGVLGDEMALTPAFDRVAREGTMFMNTFNPVPSCSPTRACLLTGRVAHQLGERASLWSGFPRDTPVVTQLLRQAGYRIGYSGKPWAPGNHETSGWTENPVGPKFENFGAFLSKRDSDAPFFFWIGNTDTATKAGKHPYLADAKAKLDASKLVIPPELPDCEELRADLMNYYGGVIRMDAEASEAMDALEKAGELDRTIVIYTSDNGWQMPRGLANCYDAGSHVPLAVRWKGHVPAGKRLEEFVNVADLGPTFLELAGIEKPDVMGMRSIASLMCGKPDQAPRDAVFIERERHANVRHDSLSYPMRAVRTREFLYIRNLRPDRWPAGDPDVLFVHGRPFGDVDTTRVKDFLLAHLKDPAFASYNDRIFGKRPYEELYDLRRDPHQLSNVAQDPGYTTALVEHRARVDGWMKSSGDPRVDLTNDDWDRFPYHGKPPRE